MRPGRRLQLCELAAAVAKVFNQNGIDYHVTFGSLLGVVRSGEEEKENNGKKNEEEEEGKGGGEEEEAAKDGVAQNDAAPSNTQ